MAHGHGGAREGAGRALTEDRAEMRQDAEYWKARQAQAQALRLERENAVAEGRLIEHDAVAGAAATAMATFAQTVRGIPDDLERRMGLTPEVSEAIAVGLDEALAGLFTALQSLRSLGQM